MPATLLEAKPNWTEICGVLTDVDDTLTTQGRLKAETYSAMEKAAKVGLHVIPVTGRSTGWAHMMLTQWPIKAVIAESGGTWLSKRVNGTIEIETFSKEAVDGRKEIMDFYSKVAANYAPLRFSVDNSFRLVDVAIDYNEDVNGTVEIAKRLLTTLQHQGFSARTSSIHINAWSGDFDKGPTSVALLGKLAAAGLIESGSPEHWVTVGDAPNDESLFQLFPNSVGVANIKDVVHSMRFAPKFLTSNSHGAGFEELMNYLFDYRS